MIANRGEIAVRIARTCDALGIGVVAVHSDVDADSMHVRAASEAIALPGVTPTETYLNIPVLIEAARNSGAEAVHPGYGFLAESDLFAEAVIAAGLVWVGPSPHAIRALGDKISARRIAIEAGVPVVPGLTEPIVELPIVESFARDHGYPVAIKAAGGGGGRGLKVARSASDLADAFESARREAAAYFGSEDVYVEKYLDAPKHLEVQLLAPTPDSALWLGVRDCSLQRRHQKLIEETPPPMWADRQDEMGAAAVALSKAAGYENAGTVEMLVDGSGDFYFLEVNSRLQVEHTVTEEVLGIDLVACQLRIAAGEDLGLTQEGLRPNGHSIECRINAEDPTLGFAPTPGVITAYSEPSGDGVRVDSGYSSGSEVPSAYDSLIAKLIVTAPDRDKAIARMRSALEGFEISGIATTIPAHLALLQDADFQSGTHTTRTVEDGALDGLTRTADADVLLVAGTSVRLWNPAMSASAAAAVHGAGAGEVIAPMQGTILKVLVEEGQEVAAGDPIVVVEAMKMETTISAPGGGVVTGLVATPGEPTKAGAVLAVIE